MLRHHLLSLLYLISHWVLLIFYLVTPIRGLMLILLHRNGIKTSLISPPIPTDDSCQSSNTLHIAFIDTAANQFCRQNAYYFCGHNTKKCFFKKHITNRA